MIEALRRASKRDLKVAVFAVSTVAEEIGLRGAQTSAFGVDPQVGIAVDVTHATDCPTIDKRQQGDINLGSGPVIVRGPNMNPIVVERLLTLAQKDEIPHQLAASGKAQPNDSNALQINRAGVATGLVEHSQSLHAFGGGDDFAGRHRSGGRFDRALSDVVDGGRGFSAVAANKYGTDGVSDKTELRNRFFRSERH